MADAEQKPEESGATEQQAEGGSKTGTPAPTTPALATPTPATPTPVTPVPASKPSSARAGSKTGSKTGSKPGSAKSVAGSARSARSAASVKSSKSTDRKGRSPSPKSAKSQKGEKRNSKEKLDEKPKGVLPELEDGELPDGVIPLFLASQTQEIFQCRADEDVTEDDPYKLITKKKILEDLFNRAAISDFSPIKQIIQDYAGEELLIGYDADFKFGQNFFIATTEEAKNKLLHPPETAVYVSGLEEGGEVGEGGVPHHEQEDIVYKYTPPTPKDWVSLGSEKDIQEESLVSHRKRLKMCVKRRRCDFGSPCMFTDRDVADAKDGFIECTSYDDKTFDLKKIELDKAIQAIPDFCESSAQTDWKFPRNAVCQYEAREMSEEQQEEILEKPDLTEFINRVSAKFEVALQQNEIMDVFFDDWINLTDEDSSFGSKADNHLKEYQSFTDLQFSKGKTVTAIEWHPTIRGIVAVSVAERMSFDDRIDHAAKVIMNPSLILLWSFSDPIHPQILLEAPDDMMCFKFSPSDSNIICGGCINGQIVLWDISQYSERLKQPRSKRKDMGNSLNPGYEDENSMETPIVRYCAVSSIENSHRSPVTDLIWLPDHMEVNRMGVPQENKAGQSCQVISCGTDQLILFWDTRPPKNYVQHDKPKDPMNIPMGVPDTFKHLDLTWKPMLKVNLYKSEPGGDHAPTKFSISERQGDRSALSEDSDEDGKKDGGPGNTMQGGFTTGARTGSAKRTLRKIKTHFYCGTEDGEIVYVDWMPQKDQDSGKLQTPKPDYYHAMMDGPVVTLQRSPFFKDILLCIGGWTFTIWKEGVTSGPILNSCASSKRYTAGHWSPSRPAVFFITKQDGSVDIWDLLDRTHEPSMNQSVSPTSITSIYPFQVTNKQHLLAVGDNSGTLHILEIPWSLRQPIPNELQGISNYFDREMKRLAFVVSRWDFREKEKIELETEAKKKAGIAPNIQLSEEEIEYRMKLEYEAFVKDEHKFLVDLGLAREEEDMPQIPE